MNLARHLGILGVYVLILGSLSRYLLKAPRTIGFEPKLYDFFLIISFTLLGALLMSNLFSRWKQTLRVKPNRPPSILDSASLERRLRIVAVISVLFLTASVAMDRTPALDRFTPYHLLLGVVSLAGSFLVEALTLVAVLHLHNKRKP